MNTSSLECPPKRKEKMNAWHQVFFLFFGLLSTALARSVDLKATKEPFTLEEATLDKFRQKKLQGVWISDTELEYQDLETKDINVLNAVTLKVTNFVPGTVIKKYCGESYNVSADRRFVLIRYDTKIVYRRSKTAKYVVYSVKDKSYYNVSGGETIQTALWSPKGNALAYVYKNNLYYLPMISSTMKPKQITTDGIPNVVFNGVTDWVYEEEVLCTDTAFSFSPEGDQMIYTKFIDHNVGVVKYMEYGTPGDYSNLYPKETVVRFPKVDTPNPVFKLWWVNLSNITDQKLLDGYSKGSIKEVYYGTAWLTNNYTATVYSNRFQNESVIVMYSLDSKISSYVIFENQNKRGWANTEIPKFTSREPTMIKIEAQPFRNDEYDHLKVYDRFKGNWTLTSGAYEVIEVLDWDRDRKVIYYTATEENSPSTIQVYRVNEAKGSKPYCLSCRIKSPEGRGCKYATAAFSKNFTYVVIQCNGPDPRMTYLFKNENPMQQAIVVLENSAKLRETLTKKLMPEIMNLTAPVPGPFNAEVRMFLPPNMDKSGKTKYPMLVYVYGGINSKQIYDDFKIDYEMYWTTNRNVIYTVIDARNSNNKGKNMLYAGYKRIGTYEMEDQITVAKYLQKKFSFIDTTRTGIWGWSFGGYSTLKIMQMDKENVFKCGVAVAPAVDWVLYDTMWSERYMGSFKTNRENYLKASLFTDVKSLRNKTFYILTGNADDNVHYQQPMLLNRALELNDITFDFQSYPDEAHSLFGVRPHLYHSMDKFWRKCFNL